MTPKEELIQAIERSPDEIVQQLLVVLKTLEHQQSPDQSQPVQQNRIYRKQGVLVIDTGELSSFNINTFISELREERIQDQIGKMGL